MKFEIKKKKGNMASRGKKHHVAHANRRNKNAAAAENDENESFLNAKRGEA